MQTFAVFGNPIEHSKSPNMHNYFFKQKNINAKYIAICADDSKDIIKKFEEYNLDGANITIPFKEDVFGICDEVIGLANKAKSVNTIIKKNNKFIGYNTDADGFLHSIKETFGNNIKNAIILGAGGTAKSIAYILKENNINTTILNRSYKKLEWFERRDFICYEHNNFKTSNYDLIINTTSAGLNDESLPLDKDILKELLFNATFAYDVIYNKQTPFVNLAKDTNTIIQNGKDMLIYQGAFASLLFMDNKYSFKESAILLKNGFDKDSPY